MPSGLKEYLDIAQSLTSMSALSVGGAWAYYRFIKGRLFSPKIELSMEHVIVKSLDSKHHIVFCEICLKNMGSVQLRLGGESIAKCFVVAAESELTESKIFEKRGFVRYEDAPEEEDYYYVDPGENTYRQLRFTAPTDPPALLVSVRLMYNKLYMVDRKFAIINEPTPIKAS
jgi:hypothetical protein